MNKVVKNYLYNLSYQILILIIPLVTTPYISRVLGAKGIGIYSYTNSIVQYFIIFGCIGLNLYGQREIAYVQHDRKKRNIVFWELIILRLLTVSTSLLIFFNALVLKGEYSNIYLIMILDILASMFDISWFFQGIEEFKKIVLRNFVTRLVGVFLIFLLVKSEEDLWIFVLSQSVTLFIGNISLWIYIPKLVDKVSVSKLSIIRHIRPTLVLFFPQIATSLYMVFDKTMIGYLSGIEEEVAYYEQGQKIVKMVMALVTSLGTVMLPRIANLYKLNETEKIKDYLKKSFNFVFFSSFPMMFGLIAVSRIIVPWFFGAGFDKVSTNMMVIAPIIVFISMSTIIGTQFLLPIGRQKEFTISVVTGCVVNFLLNILLIPHLLSIGAAIATVIAEFTVASIQIYFTRKDFDFKSIFEVIVKYFICSVIMFVPTYILATNLTSTIINTIICVATGCVLYIVLLILIKDRIILEVLEKLKVQR